MGFIFDGPTKQIREEPIPGQPSLVIYNGLQEIYSESIIWWHTDNNARWEFPFRIEGGSFRFLDDLGNAQYATLDLYLQNQASRDWRFVPQDYEHEIRISGANIFPQDPNLNTWDFTGTSANVLVEATRSDINTGYYVSAAGGLSSAQIAEIATTIAGLVPAAVWANTERKLTDSPPNTATSTEVANVYALLARIGAQVDSGQIALSSEQLGRLAAAVWANTERKLTVTPITPTEIWNYLGGRTLTGQDAGTLTQSQVDAIAAAVWVVANRGASLDEIYSILNLKKTADTTFFSDAAGDTGYTVVDGIRLERTRTIGPDGSITVVEARTDV